MSDQSKAELILILKYGSMTEAFHQWLNGAIDLSTEEHNALIEYSKTKFQNLNFVNLNKRKT
jgi:hypothetical protein